MRGEADGRKKLTMALKKRGAQVQFDLLDEAEVFSWVNKRLKPLGKTMTREAAAQMCFAAGRELTRLCGEVDKLADCVGERETIDLKDVERMVSPSLEYSVFEMLDALFSGEEGRAQDRLCALLAGGEELRGNPGDDHTPGAHDGASCAGRAAGRRRARGRAGAQTAPLRRAAGAGTGARPGRAGAVLAV